MRISDWSSDVCSSDLHIADVASEERGFRVSGAHEAQQAPCVAPYVQNALAVNFDVFGIALIKQEASHRQTARIEVVLKKCRCRPFSGQRVVLHHGNYLMEQRSEERRVGKECVRKGRSRW